MRIDTARPPRRIALSATVAAAALLLTGCGGGDPAAGPSGDAVGLLETDAPSALPSGDPSGTGGSAIAAGLDSGALRERADPERLLRYYTNAIRVGDWASAARAWSLDAQMTPAKLEAEFGGAAGPKLAVGKGDVEGAAGSLYYEAPLVVDFADGRASKRGTIVLRRVNDVPGASEEQLNWRIERTSTLL
ncbi:hypothetical protein [Novosphingobium colocasiae]|uniref:hypothetical protein n=1 Tax=Novosphingobium colocasiae TaxID=1256513 RepID=UPI0035AED9FD